MQNKLKVLHVIPSVSASRGGPSKAVIEMVSALRGIDIDAEIVTTNDHGSHLLDVELGQQIQYKNVPVTFFKRFSPSIKAVREFAFSNDFRRWLKCNIHHYDVIHVHAIFSFCSSYAMFLARKKKIPYIVRPIGQLETWSLSQSQLRKKLYLALSERKSLIHANAIHFTAESEKHQALLTLPELKSNVIPLGINSQVTIENAKQKMHAKWSLKSDAPTLLFLSRLHPKKGIELILNSLAKTNADSKTNNIQFIIAGDGDTHYKKTLKAKIKSLNLESNCHLVGYIEGQDKQILLQGADLFILPSHSENFGIAVLEAMASGTPVIVSSAVALAKEVHHHKLGYVCELNENSIIKKLELALENKNLINQMGLNAAAFTESHYAWNNLAKQILELYKKLSKS